MDSELPARNRIVAFPARQANTPADQLPEVLPGLRRFASAYRSSDRVVGEVPDRIAIGVVVAGFVLCGIGTLVTPTVSVGEADLSMFAQLISTIFWGAAFFGSVGLFYRRTRGLYCALIAGVAFLSAPITAVVVDPGVVGRMWAAQLVCAVEFCVVCCGALWSVAHDGERDARPSQPHVPQATE